MTTDWTKTKTYIISLRGITEPWEIIEKFKQLGIKKHTYQIIYKGYTLKFGMSSAMTTQEGERTYRQIGHLDSFKNKKITGPNGSEFLDVVEKFKTKYGIDIDHNDITIIIWSFDHYDFRTIDMFKEVLDAETELIENYKKLYGELPLGNIDDNKLWRGKTAPRKDVCDNLFDWS
jgi:hypothetical protein